MISPVNFRFPHCCVISDFLPPGNLIHYGMSHFTDVVEMDSAQFKCDLATFGEKGLEDPWHGQLKVCECLKAGSGTNDIVFLEGSEQSVRGAENDSNKGAGGAAFLEDAKETSHLRDGSSRNSFLETISGEFDAFCIVPLESASQQTEMAEFKEKVLDAVHAGTTSEKGYSFAEKISVHLDKERAGKILCPSDSTMSPSCRLFLRRMIMALDAETTENGSRSASSEDDSSSHASSLISCGTSIFDQSDISADLAAVEKGGKMPGSTNSGVLNALKKGYQTSRDGISEETTCPHEVAFAIQTKDENSVGASSTEVKALLETIAEAEAACSAEGMKSSKASADSTLEGALIIAIPALTSEKDLLGPVQKVVWEKEIVGPRCERKWYGCERRWYGVEMGYNRSSLNRMKILNLVLNHTLLPPPK